MGREPVLAANVEPAVLWKLAAHLADVVAVQAMHSDVGTLPAARSMVVSGHAGSQSRRWGGRWWYSL